MIFETLAVASPCCEEGDVLVWGLIVRAAVLFDNDEQIPLTAMGDGPCDVYVDDELAARVFMLWWAHVPPSDRYCAVRRRAENAR